MRQFRAKGVAIVYVSHRMDEIFRIADRATILRDGKHIITAAMSEFPTGTRSSALNVFVPDAVATGRYDLRPESYVRELVLDGAGRIKAAVYQDAVGDTFEQEADVFILACGAMETARLMLLSQSGRFRNGLANGSDLIGRNVTFHEYSAAVGAYDDPVYAWAGGGYVSASTFQHYEHDAARGFVSGGYIAVAGVGIPLPINWRLPGTPSWGAEAKKVDRENYSHSLAVAMVLHDMPELHPVSPGQSGIAR